MLQRGIPSEANGEHINGATVHKDMAKRDGIVRYWFRCALACFGGDTGTLSTVARAVVFTVNMMLYGRCLCDVYQTRAFCMHVGMWLLSKGIIELPVEFAKAASPGSRPA